MTIQLADSTRNAMCDAWETDIGTSAILEYRSGAPPANCAAADSGTLIASTTLPSDWMSAASAGSKSKLGTWEDLSANNAGTIGHYRLKTSGGVCKEQGTVTATGGGGDVTVDNTNVAAGQIVRTTSFVRTMPGA